MAKRILSWVLSMALLLGCVSGLTLITSAEIKEFTFDATAPGWHSGGFSTDLRDYQVVLKMNEGQTYWNNGQIAKAMGLEGQPTVDSLTLSFEYFFDCSAAEGALGGKAIVDTIKDGGQYQSHIDLATGAATNALEGQSVQLVANEWSTVTYAINTSLTLGAGHDVGYLLENMGGRVLYVRAMTVTVTVGEDTYVAKWEGEVFDPTALDYGAKLHCTDADYISGGGRTESDSTDFDTNFIGWTTEGDYIDFNINMKEAGLYNVGLIMATGAGGDATVELQDGNGKLYGAVIVPTTSWDGPYATYTVSAMLPKGQQTLRIYFAKSVANLRAVLLDDGRYTLTNADWNAANSNGAPALFGNTFAFKYASGGGKWFGLKDPNGILAESTSVTYEYEVYFDTENGNDRLFVSYGTTDGWRGVEEPTNGELYTGTGFACGGHWVPEGGSYEATSEDGNLRFNWVTLKVQNDKFDPTKTEAEEFARLGSWVDNGTLYLKSMRAYDTQDPTKVVAIEFNSALMTGALESALDTAITDFSGYTDASAAAYQAALEAGRALLDSADATQEDIDAAVADIQAAKAALAPVYTFTNVSNIQGWSSGTIVKYDGSYAWKMEGGNNKGFSLGGYNGAVNDATTLVYEVVAQFKNEGNNFHVWYGFDRGEAGAGNESYNFDNAGTGWQTYTLTVENASAAKGYADTPLTMFGHPGDAGNELYVRSFKCYDANDPSKVVALEFATYPSKNDLQKALDEAIKNLSDYTEESAAAYAQALVAVETLLAQDEVTELEIVNVLNALAAAEEALESLYFDLPLSNWNNMGENGGFLEDVTTEFDGKDCITWTKAGAAMSWNNGVIKNAAGITEDSVIADLKISVSYFWKDNGENGDWWHFNTYDKDGGNAPSADGNNPHDTGFGTFTQYGMERNRWGVVTIAREEQLLNGSVDNLFINVGGLAEGNALYVCGILYEITLEDGTVLTGKWGAPITTTKETVQAAIDGAIQDLSSYSDASAAAYKAAVDAAKEVVANENATIADYEAAVKAIKDAEAALVAAQYDVIVIDISTDKGDTPRVGDKVYFTFTVKNNGVDTIPAGSKFGGIVKIGDTMIGWSDNFKTTDQAPALAPGETLVLTLCGGPEGSDGSWTVTAEAVEVLAQVNDNPGDGINETGAALENNTFTETITPSTVDMAALEAAIADEVTDLTPYTDDSAAAYTAALEAAKAVAAKTDATQEEIDAAAKALTDAKAALTEKPVAKDGDVDGDDKITSTDARLVLQYYAKKIADTDLDLTVADVDSDGKITSTDARLILQLYAGKIDAFPTPAE